MATASNGAVTRGSMPGAAVGDANCSGSDGAGGITDTIMFPETGTITDVDVRVEITHSFRSDVQAHVTYSGGGGTVILAADHDGGDDDYYATFDDDGANACSDTAACGSGGPCTMADDPGPVCTPDNPLSAFNGLLAPGTFTIAVCDDASFDSTGVLVEWEVTADGMMGDGLPVELMDYDVD